MYSCHCGGQPQTKLKKGSDNLDAKAIGKRLAELRGDRTQTEIARLVGVTPSAISMYESGERIPNDNIKLEFSRVFKKSVQSIFFS